MHKLAKFQLLRRSEQRLFVQSLLLLPLVSLLLTLFGLNTVWRLLRKLTELFFSVETHPATSVTQAWQTAQMVNTAARHGLFTANCLSRSLTLWWLLQRRGIASDLRIGVRKAATALEAHAWVECQGHILNDTSDVHQQYVAFNRAILSAEVQSR